MGRPAYNGRQMNGAGFVYLFRLDRFHKIGSSGNPQKRLKQFDNLPWRVAIIHVIASKRRGFVERLLQHRFREQCVRGEWFDLNEADVTRLQAVERIDDLDDFPDDLLPPPQYWRSPTNDAHQGMQFKLPRDLEDALFSYMVSCRPRLTIDQMANSAIAQGLAARGFWPPPEPKPTVE